MSRPEKPMGRVAPVPERIRGGIAALLTLTCLTTAANIHDAQLAVSFGIAGIIYLMTTMCYVYGNVDSWDDPSADDDSDKGSDRNFKKDSNKKSDKG
jgi:hypothetical protein